MEVVNILGKSINILRVGQPTKSFVFSDGSSMEMTPVIKDGKLDIEIELREVDDWMTRETANGRESEMTDEQLKKWFELYAAVKLAEFKLWEHGVDSALLMRAYGKEDREARISEVLPLINDLYQASDALIAFSHNQQHSDLLSKLVDTLLKAIESKRGKGENIK